MLATLIIEGPSKELGENVLMICAMFFWSILWGAIAYTIMKKKDIVNMETTKRQKVISTQMYVITTLITVSVMLLITFIIKEYREGIIFSGAFTFALCFWEVGCVLADRVLQKDTEKNEKKK